MDSDVCEDATYTPLRFQMGCDSGDIRAPTRAMGNAKPPVLGARAHTLIPESWSCHSHAVSCSYDQMGSDSGNIRYATDMQLVVRTTEWGTILGISGY